REIARIGACGQCGRRQGGVSSNGYCWRILVGGRSPGTSARWVGVGRRIRGIRRTGRIRQQYPQSSRNREKKVAVVTIRPPFFQIALKPDHPPAGPPGSATAKGGRP